MPAPKKKRKKRPAPKHTAPGKKAGLTAQQERFIELLVVEGKSGTDSAIGAGYSSKTAAQKAYELTHKNSFVMEAIKKRRNELSMRSLATRERWEEEICRLAFLDPGQFFEQDGSAKRIQDIPEDARRAIAGLEVMELFQGQGDQRHAIGLLRKFRLPNKADALTLLGKAQGWLVEKRELTGKDGAPLVPPAPAPVDLSKLDLEDLEALERIRLKAAPDPAPEG